MATPTMTVQLKPEIIDEVKKSLDAKNALQFELGKSFLTIQRWLKVNSSKLTEAKALNIICRELGYTREQVLIED